ncbi:MAG: low specificity L-threonine aldolase [Hyphomonadaceae bacterium]
MNFISDNNAGAAPEVLQAVVDANAGFAASYGDDEHTRRIDTLFSDLFEREVRVFPVSTGTAANAIALAGVTPPWGAIVCHCEAHIEVDEAGAVEFYSGAKLALADGAGAKLTPDAVDEIVTRRGRGAHTSPAAALSVTLPNERGLLYSVEEMSALGACARRHGLAFHVDGARFANAIAALKCAPADLTWRAGVDVMSFGATKNGGLGAEAIVVFDPAQAEEIARRRKRGGHLVSKSRYMGAQWNAYLRDGLWLRLAEAANVKAARIGAAADGLLSHPVETNQVFIAPGANGIAQLRRAGVGFYEWGHRGEVRLVAAWSHTDEEIEALCALLRALLR